MLKKIAIACVGFAFAGQSFAQSINPLDPPVSAPQNNVVPATAPVYAFFGEIQGMQVEFRFQIEGGSIKGLLIVGNDRCPLSGKVDGPVIEGAWQSASGKTNSFRSTIENGVVILVTNGKTLSLRPGAPSSTSGQPGSNDPKPLPEFKPELKPEPRPAQQTGDSSLQNVSLKVGKFYSVPLPTGWKMMEGPAGTFIGSGDGKHGFGVIGLPVEQGDTLDQFASKVMKGVGVENAKVLSTRMIDVRGGEGREQIVSFVGRDGVTRIAVFKTVILRDGARPIGMVWHAATPEDQFEANIGQMMQLAQAIRMNPEETQPVNNGGEQVSGL